MGHLRRHNIYCVCNQAVADGVCDDCPKYKTLNPTKTFYWGTWPRKINGFIRKSSEMGNEGSFRGK